MQEKQLLQQSIAEERALVDADIPAFLERLKNQGLSILLTSHFMDEVEALCDEILILKKGHPVFHGTVEEARTGSGKQNFEDAYLWYTDEEDRNESI